MIIKLNHEDKDVEFIEFYQSGVIKRIQYRDGTVFGYDGRGGIRYWRSKHGHESWYDYDENNVYRIKNLMEILKYESSKEIKYIEFYENGIVKKELYYDGGIVECDERGNMIHYCYRGLGTGSRYEYDENNNIIHYSARSGFEYWNQYDERGNCIHHEDSNRCKYWYEYDEMGNITHYIDFEGNEKWWEYDERSNLTHYKENGEDRFEKWYKYNEQGHIIYSKNSSSGEEWYKWDSMGNCIYHKINDKVMYDYR